MMTRKPPTTTPKRRRQIREATARCRVRQAHKRASTIPGMKPVSDPVSLYPLPLSDTERNRMIADLTVERGRDEKEMTTREYKEWIGSLAAAILKKRK